MPEIKVLYEKQWKKSYHPVFSAAALMNPAYHMKFGYTELWEDAGVQDDMKAMIGRFFNTTAAKTNAMAQLSQYKRWQGVLSSRQQWKRPHWRTRQRDEFENTNRNGLAQSCLQ